MLSVFVNGDMRVNGGDMNGTEIMKEILKRESLSPAKVSRDMGHARTYLNTIFSEGGNCKLETLREFCEATGYQLVVRSKADGYEFDL